MFQTSHDLIPNPFDLFNLFRSQRHNEKNRQICSSLKNGDQRFATKPRFRPKCLLRRKLPMPVTAHPSTSLEKLTEAKLQKKHLCQLYQSWDTPPKFDIALKNGGWKTTYLLGRELFKGYVKLRGGVPKMVNQQHYPPSSNWQWSCWIIITS